MLYARKAPSVSLSAVCYDIENSIGRSCVRWSLTTEGAIRFLRERKPDHFVVAREGKPLFTSQEFLEEYGRNGHDA